MTTQLELCFDAPALGSLKKEAARRAARRDYERRWRSTVDGKSRTQRYNSQPRSLAAREKYKKSDRAKILNQVRIAKARMKRCINGKQRGHFPNFAAYERFLYATNPNFRLSRLLRVTFKRALKRTGSAKARNTLDTFGCSLAELRSHIERQFEPEMAWSNHGTFWEIDHIIPFASFPNLGDPNQQRLAMHWSNLRPLRKTLNKRKGARITQSHQFPLMME